MDIKKILIGNGAFIPHEIFYELQKKYRIVAVDGGANTCRKYNITPDVIIGDLDSITQENLEYFTQQKIEIIHISEQNSTDLEKAIRTIESDIFYCFGFTGKLFDHQISLLHILQRNFYNKYAYNKKIIVFSETQIFFTLKKKGEIFFTKSEKKKRISLYPLTKTVFISSKGSQYPLNEITLEQGELLINY